MCSDWSSICLDLLIDKYSSNHYLSIILSGHTGGIQIMLSLGSNCHYWITIGDQFLITSSETTNVWNFVHLRPPYFNRRRPRCSLFKLPKNWISYYNVFKQFKCKFLHPATSIKLQLIFLKYKTGCKLHSTLKRNKDIISDQSNH